MDTYAPGYVLPIALLLSPGNKAQAYDRQAGTLYVVQEHRGTVWTDKEKDANRWQLYIIQEVDTPHATLFSNGLFKEYDRFLADLAHYGLDVQEAIWQPIGYTSR
jgi:hypothetical protein